MSREEPKIVYSRLHAPENAKFNENIEVRVSVSNTCPGSSTRPH